MICLNKPINFLIISQFFAAVGDNMIIYIIINIVKCYNYPHYYVPLAQTFFLVPYLLFSSILGRITDKYPKTHVLKVGNLVKLISMVLLFNIANPIVVYFIIGCGAAIYTMPKYGLLPWLCNEEEYLVKYNSWMEATTIVAILCGGITGGFLVNYSLKFSIVLSFIVFIISIVFSFGIPKDMPKKELKLNDFIISFIKDFQILFSNSISKFAIMGTSSFWMVATVFRMIFIMWLQLRWSLTNTSYISLFFSLTGIGLILGSFIVPYFISMQRIHRIFYGGYGVALMLSSFLIIKSFILVIISLLFIGVFGAVFVVPLNACLQKIGYTTIGTGRAVACQNMMENSAMLIGMSIYSYSEKINIKLNFSIIVLLINFLIILIYMKKIRLKIQKTKSIY